MKLEEEVIVKMEAAIRNMHLTELKSFYKRMTLDFAEGEYPPYDKLYVQLENNIQKGLVFVKDGRDCAYAICAGGTENNFVLISFFAVYEEFRGTGIGTAFLEKIKELYSNADGIIVEVETVEEALNEKDISVREKRMKFYRRAGFNMVPDIKYSIWNVPMHLMVLPCKLPQKFINENIGTIIYDIYFALLGKENIHKMEFEKL
ncbi:GNAT family N-acetyltransferase [Ruminiclostridium cellobioparum]|uniref:Acetyltransferase (GNAT) family n=1 Tax=Ruminiclostridium cellobioparum subsp. termitidis CT1112 TaxID=1195236 RepID=S0FFJ6_RUMCE|nr:GNAT family N-acetyltransferase [Ruminiclostridium cellobioparum]EMS69312.1 Acetyltransferase (GNAT) family [Ruminiclostridium cellobioparum subsp. termitidis CT1112]